MSKKYFAGVLMLVLLSILFAGCKSEVVLPYEIEGLTINSVSCADVENPDNDGLENEAICMAEVNNNTDKLLCFAEITMKSNKGNVFSFEVEMIPSGKSVFAFDIDNNVLKDDEVITEILCVADYDEENSYSTDNVSRMAKLKDGEIYADCGSKSEIYAHYAIDDDTYFGGKSICIKGGEKAKAAGGGIIAVSAVSDKK